MKTIQIERPEYLKSCAREINWLDHGIDLRRYARERAHLLRVRDQVAAAGGGPTIACTYAKTTQLLDGVLMIVDARVSADLEISDVVGDLEKLAWPAGSIEMRFADSSLPAVLVVTQGVEHSTTHEKGVIFVVDGTEATCGTHTNPTSHVLSLPFHKWQEYVKARPEEFKMRMFEHGDEPLENCEAEALRYMACLAAKVIAYASVEQHRPALLTSRADIKEAGLHPKHMTREGQRAFAVRYLPHIVRDREPETSHGPSGQSRRFLGRRGFVKFYHSDYFVNMKGRWHWMPPIPPPDGVKVVYKVRSVPA